MKEELKKIFNTTINPFSEKMFKDEDRLKSISFNTSSNEYTIIYRRDGLDNSQKKAVESLILKNCSSVISEEQIILSSVSESKVEQKKEGCGCGKSSKKDNANNKSNSCQSTSSNASSHSHGAKKMASGVPTAKTIDGVDHVIAVSSCKGGVGKSTVAVNLAFSLKAQGYSVGILDADIYGPSLPTLLGQEDEKPKATDNNKIRAFDLDGVKFMSFGHFVSKTEPVIWRGPMLGGVLKQFAFDTDWGKLDFLILDLPPGTGDVQLSISQLIKTDAAIVISTPQQVALSDSIKGLKMFEKINIPVLGMVENMSYFMPEPEKKYFIFGKKSVEKVATELETKFLASIPIDLGLCQAAEDNIPFMSTEKNRKTSVGLIYSKLAKDISESLKVDSDPVNKKEKKGFLNKLLNK